MMFKPKTVMIAIFIVILLCGIVILNWFVISQKKMDLYELSSFNPNGYKALDLFLDKEGFAPSRIDNLLPQSHQIAVVFTNGNFPASQSEELWKWVKSGGELIEMAGDSPQFTQGEATEFLVNAYKKGIDSKLPWLNQIHYFPAGQRLWGIQKPDTGIFGVDDNFLISRHQYGQGQIITWTDPEGLANGCLINHPDNAVILAMMMKKFTTSKSVVFYYPPSPADSLTLNWQPQELINRFAAGFSLLFLGIVLLVWKLSARFGRPRPLVLVSGRSYDEFITSMASLFQHANIQAIVIDNLWKELLKTTTKIAGIPITSPLDDIIERLTVITGKNQTHFKRLHQQILSLTPRTSRDSFVKLANEIDAYRKELIEWNTFKIS